MLKKNTEKYPDVKVLTKSSSWKIESNNDNKAFITWAVLPNGKMVGCYCGIGFDKTSYGGLILIRILYIYKIPSSSYW